MLSLDQVLLIQQKVESALQKITTQAERITELETENASLNDKLRNLEAAFSEKEAKLSSMELEQTRIEESILHTLSRLDTIEDSLLKAEDSGESTPQSDTQNNDDLPSQSELNGQSPEPTLQIFQNNDAETASSETEPAPHNEPEAPDGSGSSPEGSSDLNGQFDIF